MPVAAINMNVVLIVVIEPLLQRVLGFQTLSLVSDNRQRTLVSIVMPTRLYCRISHHSAMPSRVAEEKGNPTGSVANYSGTISGMLSLQPGLGERGRARMVSFKVAHCPGAPTELPHKKRRTQTFRMPQSRSVCAFPRLQILAFAGMALYNKTGHEHTSHGEGLAMDAGQSC